jgi:class 3 adenylate cyclase/alpha-beta hydrolase superfamily lysophospholipase
MPKTRYARSGDLQLAYQVVGDGPLDLVFVPGFVSHIEAIWEEPRSAAFLEHLAAFSRLIVFDKRGMGLSDRPPEPPTLEQGMDDVLAVMDAAGSERAALLGASEGGPMSMLCAATYPQRVSALALFATFPRILEADDYPHGLPEEVVDAFFDVLEEDWGGPAAIGMFAPSLIDDQQFRDSWARYLRLGTSPRGAQSLLRMYKEIDIRDVLATISVPTLVLHRESDLVVQIATGRFIAEQIPGARFVQLSGEDHLPWAGDWQALVGEVEEFLTGERAAADIDRVLATVMFTDIVGSTESAARLGDRRWGDVVARHDELVRRKLDRYRGRPVKTLGDGFLATFDGPARAVRCAREIAEEVRSLGIEVRAGLHTGECELVGDDVAGMAINIGARVSSLAGPGEVLVSRTVKDLVYGSGIEFAERGEHTLKGVPGGWQLYAVEGG